MHVHLPAMTIYALEIRIPSGLVDPGERSILSLPSTMFRQTWSGRRGSNPRLSPWQGDALPLSHSRLIAKPPDNGALIPTTRWAVRDSNSHGLRQRILSPPCLPISATAHNFTWQ